MEKKNHTAAYHCYFSTFKHSPGLTNVISHYCDARRHYCSCKQYLHTHIDPWWKALYRCDLWIFFFRGPDVAAASPTALALKAIPPNDAAVVSIIRCASCILSLRRCCIFRAGNRRSLAPSQWPAVCNSAAVFWEFFFFLYCFFFVLFFARRVRFNTAWIIVVILFICFQIAHITVGILS